MDGKDYNSFEVFNMFYQSLGAVQVTVQWTHKLNVDW